MRHHPLPPAHILPARHFPTLPHDEGTNVYNDVRAREGWANAYIEPDHQLHEMDTDAAHAKRVLKAIVSEWDHSAFDAATSNGNAAASSTNMDLGFTPRS